MTRQRITVWISSPEAERGSILLIVLWVVMALSVLAFGFASDVQIGARSIRNSKEGTVGYYLAKSAVNESIYTMSKRLSPSTKPEEGAAFKQQCVSRRPLSLQLTTGSAQCWIENESGKLDVNAGSPLVLRRLLAEQFDLPDSTADSIVSQWKEWLKVKVDSKGATQGGPLLAVESMLRFDGMKPDYLYGYWLRNHDGNVEHRRGLLDMATVYSNSARINLNYAPVEILGALPGVDSSQAQAILTTRNNHYFESLDDCQQRVPIQFDEEARNLVSVEDSAAFTLVASGRAADSSSKRTVRAIVRFGTSDPMGYRIVYWKDEEI